MTDEEKVDLEKRLQNRGILNYDKNRFNDPAYVSMMEKSLVVTAPPITAPTVALRYDTDKPRFDLLPWDALRLVSAVSAYGAKKYADRNWENGMPWGKMIASLCRHLASFMCGYDYDEESKLPHLAHVAWNALGLLAYFERKIGTDDRGVKGGYLKP